MEPQFFEIRESLQHLTDQDFLKKYDMPLHHYPIYADKLKNVIFTFTEFVNYIKVRCNDKKDQHDFQIILYLLVNFEFFPDKTLKNDPTFQKITLNKFETDLFTEWFNPNYPKFIRVAMPLLLYENIASIVIKLLAELKDPLFQIYFIRIYKKSLQLDILIKFFLCK